ncbi:MAG: hypothetical protein Terrestrivirus1_70 [Terrestrivirus sp.]|uniref:SprT-like domain-containing protein n=1 Tax=Terrestrivirus sp. TaxID=2487775 RepID=A0A3G4ZK39_9VIRU|nr:MAG: hypothetical protein Terrestrivirus1_70 [Terrestrivirus sp.]
MDTLTNNESKDSIKRVNMTSNNVINTLIENKSKDSIKRVNMISNNVINTLDDYIVYYLNNPLGHNEINDKNSLVKKILDSHQSISTSSIRDCFNAIDTIFFNRTITEKINKDNYILAFDFTNKLKKRAGQFVYSYQTPKLRIDVSKIILDEIFKDDIKVVEIGGVKLRDLNDVLVNIMQHEMLHLILFLLRNHPLIANDKKVSSGHTKIFKILAKNIFGHVRVTHDLLKGDIEKFNESNAQAKVNINIGDSVKCTIVNKNNKNNKIFEGKIVKIGSKYVVVKTTTNLFRSCYPKDITIIEKTADEHLEETIKKTLIVNSVVDININGVPMKLKILEKKSNVVKVIDLNTNKHLNFYYWALI